MIAPAKNRTASGTSRRRPRRPGRIIESTHERGFYSSLGYRAVNTATRDGLTFAAAQSGDQFLATDRKDLLNQSRDFHRNNAIYAGMIERASAYIVGDGFGLQMMSRNRSWNQKAEALWRDFWQPNPGGNRPEVRGLVDGPGLEELVCQELLLCGDTSLLKIKGGRLQHFEAEQLDGGRQHPDGIRKDDYGGALEYFLAGYGRRGRIDGAKAAGQNPANVLYLVRPSRPSASRGVPPCQASFPMLHRINDVCDSEAIAWQLLARLAVSITRAEGAGMGYAESQADPDKTSDETTGDMATRVTDADWAMIFHAEPGEEIKGIERNIPGKDFPKSLEMFLRLLGLPLGLPLEIVLLDWTKSNYSQSRAVLQQAYRNFTRYQRLLAGGLLSPTLSWKLAQWIKAGKLTARPDARWEWITPTWPWVDELKEAQAQAKKLSLGLVTHQQVIKTLGHERFDVMEARQAEIIDAMERAAAIEAKTGIRPAWEHLAGLEPAAQSAVPAAPPAEDKENEP